MMYRFLFVADGHNGDSHCEHRHYSCDADAMCAARHRLNSRPHAQMVYVYRFSGHDTCGLMSYVANYKK